MGLHDYLSCAAVQARRRVEVRHHCLGQDTVGQDVHIPIFGAKLHRAPSHGLHLSDERLPPRAAPYIPGDLHPVPHLERRIQVHGDARKEIAQGLLHREANDSGCYGTGAQ